MQETWRNNACTCKTNFLQSPTFDLFNFFPKHFFPKFELPNLSCGLSASAAYMLVFTVFPLTTEKVFVVAFCGSIFNGSTKSLQLIGIIYLFLISNFTRLLIKVMEYARFQSSSCCNDNSFMRHENCEQFSFYCVLSVFEQHSPLQISCNFFQAIRSPFPQVQRCPWVCAAMLCTCTFLL